MAATLLFSHHSSNPLEAHSSDTRNQLYLKVYKDAKQKCDFNTSDDPLESYPLDDIRQYHDHIAQVVLGQPQKIMVHPERFIDLDEDMDSDDELQAIDDDATPQKAQDSKQENIDDEDRLSDEDEDELDEYHNIHEHNDYDEEMDAWDGIGHPDYDHIIDESEEEQSLKKKSDEEQIEIQQEIEDFMDAVPQLEHDYKLIDRLGTGTFSSVYKAIDLHYHEWDNTPWLSHHPPESSAHYQSLQRPKGSRAFVAIKQIYVTSGPERIRNELMIMEMCRGCRHISHLITAFRHEDQVAIVMPYHRNDDFRDYYPTLAMEGIKAYFRCLLQALRDIHERGIIHRDVKPANFLFDPRTGQGSLCDFGLAQRVEKPPLLGACLHTNPLPDAPHGRTKSKNEYNIEFVKKAQTDARAKSKWPAERVGYPDKDQRMVMKANRAGTRGFRAPEVLLKCGQQSGAVDIWSVGVILLFFLTGKFPIFQSNDDIEALMEIAAVIGKVKMEKVATLHSRTFATNVPDIKADEVTWQEFVERLNPDIYTRPEPDTRYYPYTSPIYCAQRAREEQRQRQGQVESAPATDNQTAIPPPVPPISSSNPFPLSNPLPPQQSTHFPSSEPSSPTTYAYAADIDNAFDLLDRLLNPESTKRITPRDALYHRFLREESAKGDDHYLPHPYGKGICNSLHFKDEVTEQPGVILRIKKGTCDADDEYTEVRKLVLAGEGIAVGNRPCEFHKDIVSQ